MNSELEEDTREGRVLSTVLKLESTALLPRASSKL